MKNLILILSVLFSSNCFATQLETYIFDNLYESITQPSGNVENVNLTNDEDGGFSLTVNCDAKKNEMFIQKLAAPNDIFGKKSDFARVDFDSSKNCLATSGLISSTVGYLAGVVKVEVNPKTHKIVDAVIYKTAAEMRFSH